MADTMLSFVLDEIKYLTEDLGVTVIVWCTDAGGDAAKMRRLLQQKMPHLITLDCWSHQVSDKYLN